MTQEGSADRMPLYVPVGRMEVGGIGSDDVDYVTLDGRRVENVIALDDVEGWVQFSGPNLEVDGDHVRTFHRKGVIRVHWRSR